MPRGDNVKGAGSLLLLWCCGCAGVMVWADQGRVDIWPAQPREWCWWTQGWGQGVDNLRFVHILILGFSFVAVPHPSDGSIISLLPPLASLHSSSVRTNTDAGHSITSQTGVKIKRRCIPPFSPHPSSHLYVTNSGQLMREISEL